jgi:hypothetical protein
MDYHLSSDSSLLYPDATLRVFADPETYAFRQRLKDLRELGFDQDKLLSASYYADIVKSRVYSVLTREEINELLTPHGTVWFIGQATEMDVRELSRLYEVGIPWPLRSHDDDLRWTKECLIDKQIDYLNTLLQPIAKHAQIIIELEHKGWEAPNQPDGGPVKQVRAYWQHIAKETGEDIRLVRRTALALHRYYECIKNFVKQQRLDEWRVGGGTAP